MFTINKGKGKGITLI